MILYKSDFINNFNQKIYNLGMFASNFCNSPCPKCQDTGTLSFHGTYPRSLYTDNGKVTIRIQRCRCSACGSTHAVLPSFIIPYSRVSLPDAREIVTGDSSLCDEIMIRLSIARTTILETKRKFDIYWKHLVDNPCSFSFSDLTSSCISSFGLQFLQIRFLFLSLIPT